MAILRGWHLPVAQSYNIEMVEVIGGRFWKPYGSTTNKSKAQEPAPQAGFTPAGIDPNTYRYRAPIDLSNLRLRKLAAALSPAYVPFSGTSANSAYFQDSDNAAPANAPAGFSGVLTREEWKGVLDFSHAVNAEIVTSVATGPGSRDAQGVWTSDQARQLFEYTKAAGGRIAASEFMNEPTYAAMGGAPKDTMPRGMAATLRSFVLSFGKLRPIHYSSVQAQLAKVRSQCQWAAGC